MSQAPASSVVERPILMSAPMVRALLDGSKFQTRRPVIVSRSATSIPRTHLVDLSRAWADCGFPTDDAGEVLPMERWGGVSDPAPPSAYRDGYLHVPFCHPLDGWESNPSHDRVGRVHCPLGNSGDRLWVRETARLSGRGGMGAKAEWQTVEYKVRDASGSLVKTFHRAEWTDKELDAFCFDRWTPSIHMPRWASRLTLEITSVRAEKLSSITEADAISEGASTLEDFARLWDGIYGKSPGLSWDANPWAWVVRFSMIEMPA